MEGWRAGTYSWPGVMGGYDHQAAPRQGTREGDLMDRDRKHTNLRWKAQAQKTDIKKNVMVRQGLIKGYNTQLWPSGDDSGQPIPKEGILRQSIMKKAGSTVAWAGQASHSMSTSRGLQGRKISSRGE